MVDVHIDRGWDELSRGVGHTDDGEEAWVSGALPGERVRARISHISQRGRIFGVTQDVLTASAERVPVPCEHFLSCGGCDLLHADLTAQHAFKHHAVSSALSLSPADVDAVVPSPQALGYRALAKFVVGPQGELGSYRPRSHEVVDMAGCVIHAPVIETIAALIRAQLSPNLALRYVILRASVKQDRVLVTLVVRRQVDAELKPLVTRLAERSEVAQVVLHVNESPGNALLGPGTYVVLYAGDSIAESLDGLEQRLHPGAFSQINPAAAVGLYEQVLRLADPKDKRVLDLYCGSGGISRALIQAGARRVHGVEANPEAVTAAKASSSSDRVSFQAAPVDAVVDSLSDYDLVVVNPPRKGLSPALTHALSQLPTMDLVYVSCNPKSLARDVASLKGHTHATIRRVVPVDMFPHTRHVETVLHLKSSEERST